MKVKVLLLTFVPDLSDPCQNEVLQSGSGLKARIISDPDPQHCLFEVVPADCNYIAILHILYFDCI